MLRYFFNGNAQHKNPFKNNVFKSNFFLFLQINQEAKSSDPEEKYLKQLGFHVDEPRLYPNNIWRNVTLPVFVTAVTPSESQFIFGFLKSFQHHFPNSYLIIYNLGLTPSDYSLVNKI